MRYLKWLTLALLAYVAVVFTISAPWFEVAQRVVWPQLAVTRESMMMIVAVWSGFDLGAVVILTRRP